MEGAVGLLVAEASSSLVVLCCLTTQTGFRCEGPAAHWDCLPTLALPRSLITPGCICGGDSGAEAEPAGEGPVAASVFLSTPPWLMTQSPLMMAFSWQEKRT